MHLFFFNKIEECRRSLQPHENGNLVKIQIGLIGKLKHVLPMFQNQNSCKTTVITVSSFCRSKTTCFNKKRKVVYFSHSRK